MDKFEEYDILDDNIGKSVVVKAKQSRAKIGLSEKGQCVMLKDVLDRVIEREYKNNYEDIIWLEQKLKFVESFPSKAYYVFYEEHHRNDVIKKVKITKDDVTSEIKFRLKIIKAKLRGNFSADEAEG